MEIIMHFSTEDFIKKTYLYKPHVYINNTCKNYGTYITYRKMDATSDKYIKTISETQT